MKIRQKIICTAIALSLVANTVVFGAVCTTNKNVFQTKNGYRVTYSVTCGKSNKNVTKSTRKNVQSQSGKSAEKTNTTVKEENTPAKSSVSSQANEVLALVNKYRKENGLNALTMNEKAQQAANVRAEEISRSFSHTRPDGRAFYTALDAVGIRNGSRGENIASGYKTPSEVMTAWMNSSGHRANILSKSYKELGIGIYKDGAGRLNWVQLFVG